MEEDEDRDNGKVFTVKEEVKPVEEPKVPKHFGTVMETLAEARFLSVYGRG